MRALWSSLTASSKEGIKVILQVGLGHPDANVSSCWAVLHLLGEAMTVLGR